MHFEIPAEYRAVVWKVMLGKCLLITGCRPNRYLLKGVLPVYREAWEFVAQQHEEQYEDVKHTALLIRPSALGAYVYPVPRASSSNCNPAQSPEEGE